MSSGPFRRLAVFCGSAPGADPAFVHAAAGAGRSLAERGIGVVYGGGQVGLMGKVADAALDAGGEVIGVIPERLQRLELSHPGLTRLEVVADMHVRKARMAELSDGFLTLPGGWGTWEELFEAVTWSQLGYHRKPVGVLDVAGYYEPVRALMARSLEEGFVRPEVAPILTVGDDLDALLQTMAAATWPPIEQWLREV